MLVEHRGVDLRPGAADERRTADRRTVERHVGRGRVVEGEVHLRPEAEGQRMLCINLDTLRHRLRSVGLGGILLHRDRLARDLLLKVDHYRNDEVRHILAEQRRADDRAAMEIPFDAHIILPGAEGLQVEITAIAEPARQRAELLAIEDERIGIERQPPRPGQVAEIRS